MPSNDQKIIDEILRTAIIAYRRPCQFQHNPIIELAKTLKKKGLVSSKVKLHWAKIERDMDMEIFELGGKTPSGRTELCLAG